VGWYIVPLDRLKKDLFFLRPKNDLSRSFTNEKLSPHLLLFKGQVFSTWPFLLVIRNRYNGFFIVDSLKQAKLKKSTAKFLPVC